MLIFRGTTSIRRVRRSQKRDNGRNRAGLLFAFLRHYNRATFKSILLRALSAGAHLLFQQAWFLLLPEDSFIISQRQGPQRGW